MHKFLTAILLTLPLIAHADWTLDNEQSELSFMSVKAEVYAEQHRFTSLSGQIDAKGKAGVSVDLSSVETRIPIRNERMKEFLFDVAQFPTLEVSTSTESINLSGMKVGDRMVSSLSFDVSLHGSSKTYPAKVSIVKLDSGSVQVQSVNPVVVNAADFSLLEGVSKLQALAGLPSISPLVPVSFLLTFNDL